MKLIKGQTLAALLKDRGRPTADLIRFLGVFEAVCQAVGYAHSRGVIHRDLKPANVMVGAFGEVQVMDWGLAKSLSSPLGDGLPTDDPPGTVIDVGRDPDGHTQAGSQMGTPAYMPPEQAKGEIDRIDRRADVFALGAVLCEILTGQPPYTGSAAEVKALAVLGHLGPALERLATCKADQRLLNICSACLHLSAPDRPGDATEVAGLVADARRDADRQALHFARAEARSHVRAAVCGALSLAGEIGGDPEDARRWLIVASKTTVNPEGTVPGFFRTLDAHDRPDLAYRLAARLLDVSGGPAHWSTRPDVGLRADAAWFALRWAAGLEGCPPHGEPDALAAQAVGWMEDDLADAERAKPVTLQAWAERVNGRMPVNSSPSWPQLFRRFPELTDRWGRVEDRVRELCR
jgi:serine/threonine protein kinase